MDFVHQSPLLGFLSEDLGRELLEKNSLKPAIIEDSNMPVGLARLASFQDGSFIVLVHFPTGWERRVSGFYQAREEFFVLKGELVLNDIHHKYGSLVVCAAFDLRWNTLAKEDTLVVAMFSEVPRWEQVP